MPSPGYTPALPARFAKFLDKLWAHLGLPPPTAAQVAIADYLQVGPQKRMVMAFRGVGKSWITCAFVVWRLDQDPDIKVEIVSANEDLAKSNAEFIRRIIMEYPGLSHLHPQRGRRNSITQFDVGAARISKDPSVKAVGITGQLTGTRADILISDDVEVPKNSLTAHQREQLKALVVEYEAVLKPDTGEQVWLGTPQSEDSIYNALPAKGVDIKVFPARVPAKPEAYHGRLFRAVQKMVDDGVPAGTATDPTRFDEATLLSKEMGMGKSAFALQFMLDTTLSDADRYPLRLRDLIVAGVDKERGPVSLAWMPDPDKRIEHIPCVGLSGDHYFGPAWTSDQFLPFEQTFMAIDPSGRGADETAYAVVRVLRGTLFLVDAGGFRGGYEEETLGALAKVAERWKPTRVIVEDNFGDGMFTRLLKPVLYRRHKVEVEERKVYSQKEARIVAALEPVFNSHRLVVDPDVIRRDYEQAQSRPDGHLHSLFWQMSRLTKQPGALKHDDRLDALEAAVSAAAELLERDAREQDRIAREQARDAFLRRMAHEMHRAAGNVMEARRLRPGRHSVLR